MTLDDPLLPAARHLFGTDARDLLATTVASFGGDLLDARAVQVQHRPGHDVVVRYDTEVSWQGGPPQRETLLAATTAAGPPEGAVVLEAEGITAGVWRYPFDPRLPGLSTAVRPDEVAPLVADLLGGPPELEVVAYRPTRRAVVAARAGDRAAYLKVVRPKQAAAIAERHRLLAAAGLPVPEVRVLDEDGGLLVLTELRGQNLRDRLVHDRDGWPRAEQYQDLLARLAEVELPDLAGSTPRLTPLDLAEGHGRAVTAFLPDQAERLARIAAAIAAGPITEPDDLPTIHGDFYEAQLIVGDQGIGGLLDLDDLGPGHPLDDPATLLAHLHILRPSEAKQRDRLRRYRTGLRARFADGEAGRELDLRTAAVLVGLATGPFRAQGTAWEAEVRRRLMAAERLARRAVTAGEKTLRTTS